MMLELGISQAQTQFTKLLNKTVLIVDKKAHKKKAVLVPYEEYINLINKSASIDDLKDGIFTKFTGVLDNTSHIDDEKYNRIVN